MADPGARGLPQCSGLDGATCSSNVWSELRLPSILHLNADPHNGPALFLRGRQAGQAFVTPRPTCPPLHKGSGGSLHKPCPVAAPAGAGTNSSPSPPVYRLRELTTLRARKWGETESPGADGVHFPGPLRVGRVWGSPGTRSNFQHHGQGPRRRRGPAHRARGTPEPGCLRKPVVSAPGAPPAATPQLFPGLEA